MPLSMTAADKARLRREMRDRRRSVPPREAWDAARRAAVHARRLPPLASARRIGCYLAMGGELDAGPVIEAAWWRGQSVFLPVIDGDRLAFAPFEPGTPLVANRYGIPEPDVPRQAWCRARQLDVVMAPLVAFDAGGHRLGMGGGFYDRTLAFRRFRRCFRRPWFIGIAYGFQRVPRLESDPWDVGLDAVVTDEGSLRCRLQGGTEP